MFTLRVREKKVFTVWSIKQKRKTRKTCSGKIRPPKVISRFSINEEDVILKLLLLHNSNKKINDYLN
jgi:hypothetical protein